jgi:hypothetical protein
MSVFEKGKYYTCIYNDGRAFTEGKKYICESFEGKFSTALMKDQSHAKFISDEGNLNTLFGSIAVGCFSDDALTIRKRFVAQRQSYREYTIKSFNELVIKLDDSIKQMNRLFEVANTHNKYCKLLGESELQTPTREDASSLELLIEKFKGFYVPQNRTQRFIDSPKGLDLLRYYKMEETGTWKVIFNKAQGGTDQFYTGTLQSVIDEVIGKSTFDGNIVKINIQQL